MSPFLFFNAVLLLALAPVSHAQTVMPAQRVSELRTAVQKSQLRSLPAPAPRQLTPEERAELRRQVQQVSARPTRL